MEEGLPLGFPAILDILDVFDQFTFPTGRQRPTVFATLDRTQIRTNVPDKLMPRPFDYLPLWALSTRFPIHVPPVGLELCCDQSLFDHVLRRCPGLQGVVLPLVRLLFRPCLAC